MSMIGYNSRTVCDCLDNPFQVDCGIPSLKLPPMYLDDSYIPNKRDDYIPDSITAVMFVPSGKYVRTLNAPSDLTMNILPSYDSPST